MPIQSTGSLSDSDKPSPFQFGTWYPIESAPKDVFILLFCPEDGSRWLAKWQGGQWYGVDDDGLTRCGMGPHDVTGWAVTHWMPLPPPPGAELNISDEAGSDAVSMMKIPSSKDLKGESE